MSRQPSSHAMQQAAAKSPSGAQAKRPDDVFTSIVVPFPYAQSYHHLIKYLKQSFDRKDILRIIRAIALFRPSMIALQAPLSFDDEVFIEKSLQRTLIELEKLMGMSGTPTIVFRRTGELLLVSDEFLQLTGHTRTELLSERQWMWTLMDQSSLVDYYEGFAAHAFENSLQAFVSTTALARSDGAFVPCASCFAIRRDLFGLPLYLIGQFLPTSPSEVVPPPSAPAPLALSA